jgi:hypothetical protein
MEFPIRAEHAEIQFHPKEAFFLAASSVPEMILATFSAAATPGSNYILVNANECDLTS